MQRVSVSLAGLLWVVAAGAAPAQRPVYFVRDVAPIFDRGSCSTGGCHGKFGGGQGRLALSLATLAPIADFPGLEPLVDLQNPARSLLLTKAAGQVEHAGGRRFKVDSPEYETIRRWIAEGCRNPNREPLPVRIWTKPERFVFGPDNKKGRIEVFCEYADGAIEDVTERTRFIPRHEDIATVTDKGFVRAERWGMTVIICRYVGLVAPVAVSMPRPATAGDPPPPEFQPVNLIDSLVRNNLKWLNLNPAGLCDDYTFLRRVSLDLVGRLPEPDEIRTFVAETAPDKREKLVDRLLADPRFVDLRTLRLGDMLRIKPNKLANGPLANRAAMIFDAWVRDSVAENKPVNQFARELLTATGSNMLSGPVNFWRVETTPENRAETVAQAFLGIRLSCARCHNHPFDRWNTDDYWQFAAFMAKIRERNGELFDEKELYHDPNARLRNQSVTSQNKGEIAQPTFLGGPRLDDKAVGGNYLGTLADWLTAPENPWFAKAQVNRIWSHLLGAGIIEPVDDLRETSVATIPAGLTLLATEFIRHGYDSRWLIRTICTSRTYQAASDVDETNRLDHQFFSHYLPKQMLPQVMLDAINQATGTTDTFGTFPRGMTAVELPLLMRHDFLDRFGRSDREFLANLDPHVEPTLPQTLHLINSAYINNKISGGILPGLERDIKDDRRLTEELYLRTVSRPPTAGELAKVLDYVKAATNRREAFEDLLWALLTSREFLFIS